MITKRNPLLVQMLAAFIVVSAACSSGERAADAIDGGRSDAESLFNGRDLTGWNGDPLFWRVENGTIVGQTTEETPTRVNTFLIWSDGTVDDFTLTLDFKLTNHKLGINRAR